MTELFFGGNAGPFTAAAVLGTLFFVTRLGLMLIGGADWSAHGDVGVDVDVDVGGDVGGHVGDVDAIDAHGHDSTEAFKVLSVQSIAAFLMGFGWGGLGALKGAGWNLVVSTLFALTVGVAMMWTLAKLLRLMRRLEVAGNVDIAQALLAEGTAYTFIPARGQGRGEVRLVIDQRARFYRAVSEDDRAIESHAKIRVTSVNEDNTVTVTRA